MFKIIKLKRVLIAVLLIVTSILCSVGIVAVVESKNVPKSIYTIVLDAGHGGRDDGCTGVSGVKEQDINLKITKTLKVYLETLGIKVVLTRADGNGLYDTNATNFKTSDMAKRMDIIRGCKADMVISIHCNSYKDKKQSGAQVFYQEDDTVSQELANIMQSQLKSQLEGARSESNHGDYFLLKESSMPAVLIECGYLSNEREEKLLNSVTYQNKIAYSIMCGVVAYFGLCGND